MMRSCSKRNNNNIPTGKRGTALSFLMVVLLALFFFFHRPPFVDADDDAPTSRLDWSTALLELHEQVRDLGRRRALRKVGRRASSSIKRRPSFNCASAASHDRRRRRHRCRDDGGWGGRRSKKVAATATAVATAVAATAAAGWHLASSWVSPLGSLLVQCSAPRDFALPLQLLLVVPALWWCIVRPFYRGETR